MRPLQFAVIQHGQTLEELRQWIAKESNYGSNPEREKNLMSAVLRTFSELKRAEEIQRRTFRGFIREALRRIGEEWHYWRKFRSEIGEN